MQFIQDGPDVPDDLLRAHEEGRVVFFCGAGISYPADLPGFKGLVDQIYKSVGSSPRDIEGEAYNREQYDATLDLLERRLPGGRMLVRGALTKALRPKYSKPGAVDTHVALLDLARCRDGALRLVTTNFDRLFEYVIRTRKLSVHTYAAPTLPIAKRSRWNGLVYLHGLAPTKDDESALNRLVVTSGDFGLAYLTERWAARFVGELFRNYVVCFVGYSINDAVLRYMMDALAADRVLGESTLKAFAFADATPGAEAKKLLEWEAKGVAPILYSVPTGTHDHSGLHKTLAAWAETYRDGVQGKERIVVDYALTRPSGSTKQDDFVGRLLWALSDGSGLPARRFAEIDPPPSLEWLEPLSDQRYGHGDLPRFAVPPFESHDAKLAYSFVNRPAPYSLAARMVLASISVPVTAWDDVMVQIARWLLRHLDDPELVLWLAERGGKLHDRLLWMIEQELARIAKLERDGNTAELARLQAAAPRSIPRAGLRSIWRLFLTGRVKGSSATELELYHWRDRVRRDGFTTSLRLELRGLLAPKVLVTRAFRWPEGAPEAEVEAEDDGEISSAISLDLVLTADHISSAIRDFGSWDEWPAIRLAIIDDLEMLLRDILDLARELGRADDHYDMSYVHLPSISEHWQNRDNKDWVVLVELLRDAWLDLSKQDEARARAMADKWWLEKYPTFKRLALFSASHSGATKAGEWVDWLLSEGAWWLWSTEVQREVMRLLVERGAELPVEKRAELESAILAGPPREMFKENITAEDWRRVVDHSQWLRLAKLASAGEPLGSLAGKRLDELATSNPWQLADNERDEFPYWMSGTGDPDYETRRRIEKAPRTRRQLVPWLMRPPPDGFLDEDNWRDVCRERFYATALALCDLAADGQWPSSRWQEALQVWSDPQFVQRSWTWLGPVVLRAPDSLLSAIVHSVSWWMRAASKALENHHEAFLALSLRVIRLPFENETERGEPLNRAINHPVGHIAEALLNVWFARGPNDNEGLPSDLEPLFSRLADPAVGPYRHARVIFSSRLIALFRVDRPWVASHLLPLFDWSSHSDESAALWEGFLWSPRLYRPLVEAFRDAFLETANHYNELGGRGDQYAAFTTYVALNAPDVFTEEELRTIVSALPRKGLAEIAEALNRALEGAGEQREQYWKTRVRWFWNQIWPKAREVMTPEISANLARLAISARGEFPAAFGLLRNWIQSVEYPYYIIHLLKDAGHCERFPREAVQFLRLVTNEDSWPPPELAECLRQIREAWPAAIQNAEYRRLLDYVRRREG